jgi:hypothetical protein
MASRQMISGLPPGFVVSNFCSEILVPGNGRFALEVPENHDNL